MDWKTNLWLDASIKKNFKTDFNLSFQHRSNDRCVICNKYEKSMPERRKALQDENDAYFLSQYHVFGKLEKDKSIPQLDEKQAVAVFHLEELLYAPKKKQKKQTNPPPPPPKKKKKIKK